MPSAAFYDPPRGMQLNEILLYMCRNLFTILISIFVFLERVEDLKQHSWSGIKLFLLMLLGALVLIACVVIIIMLHKKHQENARKRFY